MSSDSPFVLAQQSMSRYGLTTYTIVGNIGSLLNIIIFSQPTHRRNPSSLFILAMSISAFLGLNVSTIPVIYEVDRRDPILSSQLFCQLQFYFRHSLNQMMRTFFILACIDRYIISSDNQRIRSFSNYRTALSIIPGVILFWLLLPIFPTLLRSANTVTCGTSNSTNTIKFLIYTLIMVGLIPFVSMIVFSILFNHNLKKIRTRINPTTNTNSVGSRLLRRRDRDTIRMLFIEVLCYIGTMGPLSFMSIYVIATLSMMKSRFHLQTDAFIFYCINIFLLYINNGLSFWIYLCTSRSFRIEVQKFIRKSFARMSGRRMETNEAN